MENNTNTVNISLSDYNITKSNLDTTKDLLSKVTAELNVLKALRTENNIVVLEKKCYENNYGGYRTVEKLELNIKDPEVSKTILDIISKVDTSELSNNIIEKEEQIKQLKTNIEENHLQQEILCREYRAVKRADEDVAKEMTRKLKKGYEETILDLEIDKETLAKSLADLKVNKTQEQIEFAREQEIRDLQDKINNLSTFRNEIQSCNNNPWKLVKFLKEYDIALKFQKSRSWFNTIWNNTLSALDRVQSFSTMLKAVGKLPEKENKNSCIPNIKSCSSFAVAAVDCGYLKSPY